jgi:predicted phage terminase large subunit-like protein
LLDPVRLPDSFLAAQAKNPIVYNTRYQQNPGAGGEGNLVKEAWLHQTDILPKVYDQMITVWDLSFGDSPTATYSVGLVIGIREGNYYVIDMIRKKMAVPEQLDGIREFKVKYPNAQIGVEKRANGNAAMSLLEREISNIYAFQPRLFGGSKEQRLSAILPYLRDKLVHIYSPFKVDTTVHIDYDVETIVSELTAFPLGANDDIVDCLAYGIQWLAQYGKESTAIVTKGLDLVIPEMGIDNDIQLRVDSLYVAEPAYDYSIFGDIMSRDYIEDLF